MKIIAPDLREGDFYRPSEGAETYVVASVKLYKDGGCVVYHTRVTGLDVTGAVNSARYDSERVVELVNPGNDIY